jgi:hypothetical protein
MKTAERLANVAGLRSNAGVLTTEVEKFYSQKASGLSFKPVNLTIPPGRNGLGSGYAIWPGPTAIGPDGSVNIFFQIRGGSEGTFNGSKTNAVIVILEAGGKGSSENNAAYGDPAYFNTVIASIIAQLKKQTGRTDIKLGKWGVASWSGGYQAIHSALRADQSKQGSFVKKPDYVGIFDGMHHGPAGKPRESDMQIWQQLAEDAKKGKTTFVVTHTAVIPGDYASSTDTANWLVQNTGVKREPVTEWNGTGKKPDSRAGAGNFHVIGLYDKPEPYMVRDPITGKTKPNIPGTAGNQHIQAIRDARNFTPDWSPTGSASV